MSEKNSKIARSPERGELLDLLAPYMNCAPAFAETAADRCMERGLLPGHLVDSLNVLGFLAVTVLSAQEAQRTSGVRASVLLSMALDESAFDARNLTHNATVLSESVGLREVAPAIDRWFHVRAKKLTSKQFEPALRSTSVRRYIDWICDLGFGKSMKARDLWSNVERYGLEECDRAGMLPLGRYFRWGYDLVRNDQGNLVGLKANPMYIAARAEPFKQSVA
jgi:hypothetical protein